MATRKPAPLEVAPLPDSPALAAAIERINARHEQFIGFAAKDAELLVRQRDLTVKKAAMDLALSERYVRMEIVAESELPALRAEDDAQRAELETVDLELRRVNAARAALPRMAADLTGDAADEVMRELGTVLHESETQTLAALDALLAEACRPIAAIVAMVDAMNQRTGLKNGHVGNWLAGIRIPSLTAPGAYGFTGECIVGATNHVGQNAPAATVPEAWAAAWGQVRRAIVQAQALKSATFVPASASSAPAVAAAPSPEPEAPRKSVEQEQAEYRRRRALETGRNGPFAQWHPLNDPAAAATETAA